ncbi:MAG: YncE family protein [Proteobacteria bacterium]|nr:YncE family protein [Pseudomonadota bacterium]
MIRNIVAAALLLGAATPCAFAAALELEAKIPLGDVRGRIDHLAVDPGRQRLYVAELGNDTVGVVDIKERKTIRTLTGLHEPQGIAYESSTDTVYVANGDGGSVRGYRGANLDPLAPIALGDDADNVRIDPDTHYVWVGHGRGALAAIDPDSARKVADIRLQGHPESFRLDPDGSRIFINVPDTGEIAVVDRKAGKQIAAWKTAPLNASYPLILDSASTVFAVFRHPARAAVFAKTDGRLLQAVETCDDSDDVSADPKRARVYVTCGAGFVETFVRDGAGYRSTGRVTTSSGARTSLFVPELDRLYVAVRTQGNTAAAIWVYRPQD